MEAAAASNGRVALVTGAARGIGLGIAAWLISEGWQVVLTDLDRERGAKVSKVLGDNAWFITMDVADEKQVAQGVAEVLGQFGRLDALVCNAAVADPRNITLESLDLASTRARQSEPDTEAYAASKGGLLALTHALAMSLGPEVRVNAVSPGWIDARDPAARRAEPLTDADHAQHPAGRVGTVEDVAAMVAWLLSRQAGFVTGQEFVVDGGMSKKMIYSE
ncbi:SDR family oxidoreductase [Pseudomonas lactis]|uniref:SDR family oxidoreductase n=1 Tax=Pseudomonas lactis TaxID=1615674 RepID=UPI001473436E|nr:SDR family oxidoreductase [Pseudomonas lactis]NNA51280.1 SDR family oxidoreductase [Pseudomonas lactis]